MESIFPYSDISIRLETLEYYGLIKRNEKSIHVFKFWDDLHDRNSQRYKDWRISVFQRDRYRCQKCGTQKDIQAHHIKSWKNNKDLRYVVSNGITLCRKCHLEAHGGCWKNGF
jgi:5-methylcytosine-specific restriction endonuclease McrA